MAISPRQSEVFSAFEKLQTDTRTLGEVMNRLVNDMLDLDDENADPALHEIACRAIVIRGFVERIADEAQAAINEAIAA